LETLLCNTQIPFQESFTPKHFVTSAHRQNSGFAAGAMESDGFGRRILKLKPYSAAETRE